MKDRRYVVRSTQYALLFLGFALRLHGLGQESLWYDELLQLDLAQGPLALLPARLRGHSAVPLDYVITHFWIMGGRSEAWVRFPAVVWGTLSLPLAYRLGKAGLGRRRAGLFLMALLALSPFHIQYSQEVRPYALVVLGVMVTVYAFWRLHQTGRGRYLLPLQGGMLITWLSHIFTLPVWGALVLFGLVDTLFRRADRPRTEWALLGLLATALLPLVLLLLLGWGDMLFYSSQGFGRAIVDPEKFALGVDQAVEPDPAGPEVDGPFIQHQIVAPLASAGGPAGITLFTGLAGLGILSLIRQKRYGLLGLLLAWLVLPPLLVVTFLVYRETFFAPRYIISVLPAFLFLPAAGLVALPAWLRRVKGGRTFSSVGLVLAAGLVFFFLGHQISHSYRHQEKEDWRLVSRFIAANAGPQDAIIAFHAEPALNWYYPPARAVPNTFNELATIQKAVARAPRSWVILSLFSAGEDARPKAWLSEQQAVRFVIDPRIHVYYLGPNVPRNRLLAEIQTFELPVDHALYASLARENRRRPAVARRYYQLAIQHAPDAETAAGYRAALEALR